MLSIINIRIQLVLFIGLLNNHCAKEWSLWNESLNCSVPSDSRIKP
jgi:hypothetical protein